MLGRWSDRGAEATSVDRRYGMAQLTDDCFAFGGALMTLASALELLDQRLCCVVGEDVTTLRASRGRILAEDVVADEDVPPHDNAAVDGYAVRFDNLARERETRLRVAGRAAAGHPFVGTTASGDAIRIFTGAVMPEGCDTVMMQEDCTPDGPDVLIRPGIKSGANRRCAGEDIRAGTTVLRRGSRLRPQDVGLAATVGRSHVHVFQPLRAAVFSTGDELCEPGRKRSSGAIHDSNRHMMIALLENLGCEVSDLGIVEDQLATIGERLADAAVSHQLIVTSGGMSVGEEDHLKAAVGSLGALHFWQLAIKPGRPIGLGHVRGVPFIGLPGNPVAMMVTFLRIARPMILRLSGGRNDAPVFYPVRAGFDHVKKVGRREWVRAHIEKGENGTVVARKFPRQGAGILTSLVESDGLVELPETMTRLQAGEVVSFLPFEQVL
jgi:molybdopterin molybdotransferase